MGILRNCLFWRRAIPDRAYLGRRSGGSGYSGVGVGGVGDGPPGPDLEPKLESTAHTQAVVQYGSVHGCARRPVQAREFRRWHHQGTWIRGMGFKSLQESSSGRRTRISIQIRDVQRLEPRELQRNINNHQRNQLWPGYV